MQVIHNPCGSVAVASTRSNSKQLLANLLQTPQHPQQRHSQLPPAAAAPQHPAAPAAAAKQQKGKLYSTTSSRSHSNAPLGRPSSTPQTSRPAAKKKPRFSIKDTPPPSAQALVTPQAKGRSTSAAAAAAAGSGSSAASLAALLGGAAATPNRQQPGTKADTSSRTPVQHSMGGGMAGLFATPRHSSSKPPAQPRAAVPGQAGQQPTPGPAAAGAGDAAAAVPAAAEDGQAAGTSAAAAAGGADAVTPVTGSKRRASAVNPLEVMSASRQRQRAFLDRLPAGPAAAAAVAAGGGGGGGGAGSGDVLPGLQLAGVRVPLGASLSKVWQQLQEVRKKQQHRLEENPEGDAGE